MRNMYILVIINVIRRKSMNQTTFIVEKIEYLLTRCKSLIFINIIIYNHR